MIGNLLKRLCTVAWCLTAIAAVAWYMQQGIPLSDFQGNVNDVSDQLYGRVARDFLPTIMPGLLGVFLASLLAAVMSSCDSYMISSAALFTENIYRPLASKRTEWHYVWVGRWVSLMVVMGGIGFAFAVEDVVKALTIWFKIAPMTGIAFWISLFWRRMTVAGAWCTTLGGFAAWYCTTLEWFIGRVQQLPLADSWGLVTVKKGQLQIYEPWQILFYLLVAAFCGIASSLVTKAVRSNKLERFYSLIRTPIGPNEDLSEPCQVPVGSVARPVLVDRFDIVIPRPSLTSIVGFAVGCLLSAAMVGGFLWFVGGTR